MSKRLEGKVAIGALEEVARPSRFLASGEAGHIAGAEIAVNGGIGYWLCLRC